jgi:hypothetical protein
MHDTRIKHIIYHLFFPKVHEFCLCDKYGFEFLMLTIKVLIFAQVTSGPLCIFFHSVFNGKLTACRCMLIEPNHVNLGTLCDWFIFILFFFASLWSKKLFVTTVIIEFWKFCYLSPTSQSQSLPIFCIQLPDIYIFCFDWLIRVIFIW